MKHSVTLDVEVINKAFLGFQLLRFESHPFSSSNHSLKAYITGL